MRNIESTLYTAADWTSTFNSDSIDTKWGKGMAALVTNTVAASTAKTFVDGDVDVTANTIAKTAHGWATGRKVAATTSGVLPGGLSATNYYVIATDADHFKLASSLGNALAGTPVDITSAAGGGTHTLTPAALSNASLKWQWSPDGTNWFDISGQTQNITATGVLGFSFDLPKYDHVRAVSAIDAGQVNTQIDIQVFKFRI